MDLQIYEALIWWKEWNKTQKPWYFTLFATLAHPRVGFFCHLTLTSLEMREGLMKNEFVDQPWGTQKSSKWPRVTLYLDWQISYHFCIMNDGSTHQGMTSGNGTCYN